MADYANVVSFANSNHYTHVERELLNDLDEKILKMIARNARIPFLEVARACGVSGAAIHQRVQRLTSLGVLKGTEYIIDPGKIGYTICAFVSFSLKDQVRFETVITSLNRIPEVVECHYTAGEYDILLKIYAHNNRHFLSILHDKIQPLGLVRTQTVVSCKQAIRRQLPIFPSEEEE